MERLLFLGVGTIAEAVRRALPELPASGTTRSSPDERFRAIRPLPLDHSAIQAAARGAHVLVSFPPDGRSDAQLAKATEGAAGVVYLSSTAVYSDSERVVTETSPLATGGERALLRIAAEGTWRDVGASIVRLPAFYGVGTGLHVSLSRGTFRMPGSGSNIVSRVHEDDAARFVCAAFRAPAGSLLLAGDSEPARVADVVEFVCKLFDLPSPPRSEGAEIPLSLRSNRSVDNRNTRAAHALELAYPSFREGYRAIWARRGGASSP